MRKLEQRMWDRLRPKMQALGAQYDRVESPETAPSFPDIVYTWGTKHGFIEMKASEVDAKGRLDLTHFTAGQRGWLRRRSAGGKTWLLIRTTDGGLDTWVVIKGTLAFGLPEKPTLADLDDYAHSTHTGSLEEAWLRSWL